MASVNLISAWTEYYHKVRALFQEDEDVNVIYDDNEKTLKIYVADAVNKAEAIRALLPEKQTFGNVTMYVNVYPP